jgi:outer membrane receptor protein involved in Fe transport
MLAVLAAPAAAAAPLTLVDLLRSLSASGYDILYSSDLVTANLAVPDTAPGVDLLTRVRQALAAYHLELKSDGERRFIVTRSATHPVTPATPPPPSSGERSVDEITVFASRYVLEDQESSNTNTLRHDDIEQMPGAQEDALRAIRIVPGLADNLSSRPYIRGAFLEDVLVRFDGIPMIDPFHFKNFQNLISAFDPATVDRIDIYTGGYPVKYGTRSGGVIDITPRNLDSGYENRLAANLLDYDLSSVGHSDQWSLDWLATARRSTPNVVLQPRGDIGEPTYFDALGRVRWQVAPEAALTLGWLMLDDRVSSSSDLSAEQAVAHDRDIYSWIVAEWAPESALHSRSSIAVKDTERTLNGDLDLAEAATGSLNDRRDISTVDLRSDWTYLQTSSLLWNFGAESSYEHAGLGFSRQEILDQALAKSLGRPSDANVNDSSALRSTVFGLYGSGRYRWRNLELETGLRLDHQDYHGLGSHTQVSPRLNLRFDLTSAWHLYAAWGHFFQAQRVDEWRAETSQATPDPATHIVEVIGGLEHQVSPTLHWRVQVYDNHWLTVHPYFDNYLNPLSLIPELGLDRVLLQPRGGDSRGLELSAQQQVAAQWTLAGSYTLSRVTDDLPTQDVLRSWDQTHALNLDATWRRAATSASAVLSWHSGWPTTPVQLIPASGTSPAYLQIGARNSTRWGDYLSIDLRLAHTLRLPLGDLDLWIDSTNTLNRGNPCCTSYAQLSSTGQLLAPTTSVWYPRVINLGFDWRVHPRH